MTFNDKEQLVISMGKILSLVGDEAFRNPLPSLTTVQFFSKFSRILMHSVLNQCSSFPNHSWIGVNVYATDERGKPTYGIIVDVGGPFKTNLASNQEYPENIAVLWDETNSISCHHPLVLYVATGLEEPQPVQGENVRQYNSAGPKPLADLPSRELTSEEVTDLMSLD